MSSCRSLVILIALCVFGAIHSLSIGRNNYQRQQFGPSFNNFSRPVNQSRAIPNPQGGFPNKNRNNITYGVPQPPPGQFLGRPGNNSPFYRPGVVFNGPQVNSTWGRPGNYSRPYFG